MKLLRIATVIATGYLCIFAVGARAQTKPQAKGTNAAPVDDAITTPTEATYVIGEQDVLNVTVWDNAELSGKYAVQPDGQIEFPFLGRLKAAGLTVGALESDLTRTLSDGFVKNPRIAVTLDQFRGRRIFVFGNVAAPGTYPLADGETVIEALVKAGYATASEAVIVRPKHPVGPMMLDNVGDAEVLRVNLRELEKDVERGTLSRNLGLRDGDTIFVPRVDPTRIFVTGAVRTVGAYSITQGTTVLQALALAGGPTEEAAINRVRIMRLIKGKQETIKARLSDIVLPGDTIVVPERFF